MSTIKTKPKKGAPNPGNESRVQFSISNIELVSSSLTIPTDSTEDVKFNFKIIFDFKADLTKSTLLITVSYKFRYDETEFLSLVVNNVYHILNLESYIINKKFSNQKLVKYLAEMSLSHTRGIHTTLVKDTSIGKLFIPPISLENVDSGNVID